MNPALRRRSRGWWTRMTSALEEEEKRLKSHVNKHRGGG